MIPGGIFWWSLVVLLLTSIITDGDVVCEQLIGKIWSESVCWRRMLPREELADGNKKLLKRPTSLDDNDHPSPIIDF